MHLPAPLSWLVDAAAAASGPDRFLAELGRLLAAEIPLLGGSLTLPVPHPIIAHRTWLWRAGDGAVIEALAFAAGPSGQTEHTWLAGLGSVHVDSAGPGTMLGWAGPRPFEPPEVEQLRQVARFAAAPLAALAARQSLAALLDAYLGRRSAARVQAGALRRKAGETIPAVLLYADLRDFTALSEAHEPAVVIAALDAWFERVAGAVHAFGGEVLKFIGDGMLAIFPVADRPKNACAAAIRAIEATRAGMTRLDAERQKQGLPPLPFGAALHLGEILWGNIGAADRLDFTAIGAAVNLVSRLQGLCRPLGRSILISGAVAAETEAPLVRIGEHTLRGIASPCAVYALPDTPVMTGSPDPLSVAVPP